MRSRVIVLLALMLALGANSAYAQQVKDPADLMPAKTLTYVDVRQPGPLAKEVAGLFEGSAVGDLPDSWVKFRAKMKAKQGPPGFDDGFGSMYMNSVAAPFAMLLSPEMVNEIGRIQGAGFALTGFNPKTGEPEWLAIVLPGESNYPGMTWRTLLTMMGQPAGEVEKVMVYRLSDFGFGAARPGIAPSEVPLPGAPEVFPARPGGGGVPGVPPPPGGGGFPGAPGQPGQPFPGPGHAHGPEVAMAMMPGILLVGSPDEVKNAILRAKGKSKDALSSVPAYKDACQQVGDKPGVFAYGDLSALMGKIDELLAAQQGLNGPNEQKAFRALVNPKSLKTAAGSLSLDKGAMSLRLQVGLDPKERCPLVEVLPSTPVKTDLLQFVPKDAWSASLIANDDGEKRWEKVLNIADSIARATSGPGQPLPSRQIDQIETQLGIKIGKDVAGKITTAAVVLVDPMKHMKDNPGHEVPLLFIVETTDEATAKKFVTELIPKAFAVAGGDKVAPKIREAAGQTIYSLETRPGSGIHYAQLGKVVILGLDATSVADSLNAGAKKQGMLSDPKVAAALKQLDNPIMVQVSKPLPLLAALVMVTRSEAKAVSSPVIEVRPDIKEFPEPKPPKQVDPVKPPAPKPPVPKPLDPAKPLPEKVDEVFAPPAPRPAERPVPGGGPGAAPPGQVRPGGPKPPVQEDPSEKAIKEFLKMLEGMDPMITSVTRKPDSITIEVKQAGLKPAVAKITDFALEQYFLIRDVPAPIEVRPKRNLEVPPAPDPIRKIDPRDK